MTNNQVGEADQDFMAIALTEFIVTYGASLDARVWITLIKEELAEAKAETIGTAEHLKEIADLAYVFAGLNCVVNDVNLLPDDEREEGKALIEEGVRVLVLAAEQYGNNVLVEAFYRVHKSNMSKLGKDGKPIKREDGKILKGPSYEPPNLEDLV